MAMPNCAANYTPLTPIKFLERTAALYGDRTSIVHGDLRWTWAQTMDRCRRLASKISELVSVGQTVSVLSPNSPAVYEMNPHILKLSKSDLTDTQIANHIDNRLIYFNCSSKPLTHAFKINNGSIKNFKACENGAIIMH